ncbi:MAG: D-alanyl-D-alanine carboxypeptidase/D-alanyl-D-alanine-endopeptidase [Pseudomonadota bacterium]|nr:D-alanyl-D-alanine carboxypeptidase/D-alanyl-D-alanine-endopeptidase [Pseudomonadota bacterium]
MIRRLAIAAVAASLAAWLPLAQAQLPVPVAGKLAANGIAEDSISALVLRGDTTLLSHLADRPMQPASTMKLVTTLVGLETLGPVFKGRTELRSNADLVRGVLKGDLVLRGGADADFSGEVLEKMLQTLRNQGIYRLAGNLVLDRSLFSPTRSDVGLAPFDEAPEAYYNVIPDALLVNKNMLQIDMRSSASKLTLVMQPPLEKVSIVADMRLIDTDCAKWEDGWKLPEAQQKGGRIEVVLHGTFPKNCARGYSINVVDRQEYVGRLFRATWKRLGGWFSGDVIEGVTAPDTRILAEHAARALPEVVRDINKPSDNTLARTLFLSLGSLEADPVLGSRPVLYASADTTQARADMAVRNWMRGHGINDAGLVMENGSGLSRIERISPVQMGSLLKAGLRSDWSPEFQASMPIVAVDGTMRRRLHDSPAAGHARMKTGTLTNVVAIAGYVRDALGRQCVVVAMINSEQANNGKGRAVLDALVDWVARSGAEQPPAQ